MCQPYIESATALSDISQPARRTRYSPRKIVRSEAAGMAFPLNAKYFDDFPLIFNEPELCATSTGCSVWSFSDTLKKASISQDQTYREK